MKVPKARGQLQRVCARAADLLMSYMWKMWFWGDSIGFEGLLDAKEITGDPRYLGFAHGFFKGWIARPAPRAHFEHTAPGLALLSCYEQTRDQSLMGAANALAEYLAGFRRTSSGCFLHYEDAHIELPPDLPADHPDYRKDQEERRLQLSVEIAGPCVFVDSIHFHGPFFAKLHALTGQENYRRLALDYIVPQVNLVWDESNGLFHHFWTERTDQQNGIFWGRGNGWAMLGILRTLEHLPKGNASTRRLLNIFRRQACRLRELQDASGDWHTVLDHPESYEESSIAAFVVNGFSLAIRRGWLEEEYGLVVDRAWRSMWSHMREDGQFDGVSFETFPSFRREHYQAMPRGAMVPWGQGPFLGAVRSYLDYRRERL